MGRELTNYLTLKLVANLEKDISTTFERACLTNLPYLDGDQ